MNYIPAMYPNYDGLVVWNNHLTAFDHFLFKTFKGLLSFEPLAKLFRALGLQVIDTRPSVWKT